MSRDILLDSYGRFHEIPFHLARRGHQVSLVCHSYRKVKGPHTRMDGNLSIQSFDLGSNPIAGFVAHYRRLDRLLSTERPDVIIAASDCYQIILAARLARKHGITLLADLYDNFEAYGASRVPGILPAFYRALTGAQKITVISSPLQLYLQQRLKSPPPIHLLGNAVADKFLVNINKSDARRKFGIAPDAICIGTAGDLNARRGIDVLIDAFRKLAATDKRLQLILAGPCDKKQRIPDCPNIHYLGHLAHSGIPELFSALDVGVVCISDDIFGRFCFPQKFYEMVACQLPVVASRVGEMKRLMAGQPECLYHPDNSEDLQRALSYQLDNRLRLSADVPTWEMQAIRLEMIINDPVN
jgi:teichuronic acid biosynthesis glycosyltransferase TuaC